MAESCEDSLHLVDVSARQAEADSGPSHGISVDVLGSSGSTERNRPPALHHLYVNYTAFHKFH